MLTIAVHFRNMAPLTPSCLKSVLGAVADFGRPKDFEFLFVDDTSDPGREVAPMLLEARPQVPSRVRILQFTRHQHYCRACAYSFSLAQGDLLFVSPDMILTPHCIERMRQVAALDPSHGVVRACSNHVDCFPHHIVQPPQPPRNIADVRLFSRLVSDQMGDAFQEDPFLVGDVMLVRRDVLDRVGAMDGRYYGYFGDVDYGLRAQHAGYRLVCAKGAWLLHEGAGFYVNEARARQVDYEIIHRERMRTVNEAYRLFREKWDTSLPVDYPGGMDPIDIPRLRSLSPLPFPVHQGPPPALTPDMGRFL
jgi:GT2 family glycosyltransferase